MGALTPDEEVFVSMNERYSTNAKDLRFAALVRRLAGRVEELESGLGMLGRAIYDGAPDTLWLLEEDAINTTAVECIDGLLSSAALQSPTERDGCVMACMVHTADGGRCPGDVAPTTPREAAKDESRSCAIFDGKACDCRPDATPTESTGANDRARYCRDCEVVHWAPCPGTTPTSEESE